MKYPVYSNWNQESNMSDNLIKQLCTYCLVWFMVLNATFNNTSFISMNILVAVFVIINNFYLLSFFLLQTLQEFLVANCTGQITYLFAFSIICSIKFGKRGGMVVCMVVGFQGLWEGVSWYTNPVLGVTGRGLWISDGCYSLNYRRLSLILSLGWGIFNYS